MNKTSRWLCRAILAAGAWGILALSPVAVGGCQQSLFKDSPRARNSIDKYYGNDSAVETTENRRKSSNMGFGFPAGPNGE